MNQPAERVSDIVTSRLPWDTEAKPDFVNEQGSKWWIDRLLTAYARNSLSKTPYAESVVFFVETADGYRSRVLICGDCEVFSDQNMEAFASKIDILRLASSPASRDTGANHADQ